MAIIKNDTQPFAKLPLKLLCDNNISSGAKMVYAYMDSRSSMPNGWNFFNNDIKKFLGIKKRDTIAKYLRELIESNWIERKRNNTTKGYDYIVYTDNLHNNQTRYKEIEERSKPSSQALYLVCQNLLKDYRFSMPLNRLDLALPAHEHISIRVDENGYFYDLAGEVKFTDKNSRFVWAYLWQDRFNELMNEIKQNRR